MTDTTRRAPDSSGKGVPAPWDYYYLRYFVGAIIGAGLLIALWVGDPEVLPSFQHTFPRAPHEWAHLAAVIAALGTAGLAYCYIASAPILLMHGLRFRFSPKEQWWGWLIRAPLILTTALLCVFAFYFGATKPSSLRSDLFRLLLLYAPYGFIVLLQILSLSCGKLDPVRRFYAALALQRARASHEAPVDEYVESYRHLREHGNAFLIILMEVILAAALYAADTTIRFFTVAVIWTLPATFSWFLGTWLEFGIVPGKTDSGSAKKSPTAGSSGSPRDSVLIAIQPRWTRWSAWRNSK